MRYSKIRPNPLKYVPDEQDFLDSIEQYPDVKERIAKTTNAVDAYNFRTIQPKWERLEIEDFDLGMARSVYSEPLRRVVQEKFERVPRDFTITRTLSSDDAYKQTLLQKARKINPKAIHLFLSPTLILPKLWKDSVPVKVKSGDGEPERKLKLTPYTAFTIIHRLGDVLRPALKALSEVRAIRAAVEWTNKDNYSDGGITVYTAERVYDDLMIRHGIYIHNDDRNKAYDLRIAMMDFQKLSGPNWFRTTQEAMVIGKDNYVMPPDKFGNSKMIREGLTFERSQAISDLLAVHVLHPKQRLFRGGGTDEFVAEFESRLRKVFDCLLDICEGKGFFV